MSEEEVRAAVREQIEGGDFVSAIVERIGAAAGASAVFGEPVERDGITVIPVARASWGAGGGGGGDSEDEGYGGGGGAVAAPHGFIEIAAGRVRYRRVRSPVQIALLLLGGVLAAVGVAALLQRLQR